VLLEVFVMSGALVLATRQSVFESMFGRILFYGGIAAASGIVGPCLRGHPTDAFVMAPLTFVLTAAAIVVLARLEKRTPR
jgi:hypothetical protein